MIRKGQTVHIKREWQDPGDDEFTWIALEDEDGDRVKISPVMPKLRFAPVSIVETRMLIEGDATQP
jgi:hypothetical protein